MNRGSYLKTVGILLGLALLASCATAGGNRTAPFFPKPRAGAGFPAANARLTGTLVRDGDFLRVAGNGNTVVIWPLTANARTLPGYGTVIVVWPYTATLERRVDGPGTVVVVWPRTIGAGTPVRVGDQVEFTGIVVVTDNISGREAEPGIVMVDDISGRATDCPRDAGCTGPVFVATGFRPVPADAR